MRGHLGTRTRREAFVLTAVFLGGACSGAGSTPASPSGVAGAEESAPAESFQPVGPPDLTVGEDVTEQFQAMNAQDMRPPPSVFRRIEAHVTRPAAHGKPGAPEPQVVSNAQNHHRRHAVGTLPNPSRFDGGWRVQLPSGAPVVTPVVYRNRVLASGGFRSRQLYAFDARSGEPAWAINLGDDGPSTPACDDGVCVFNTESCTIFAVDAETGEMLWSWYLGDPLMSAPAIADGVVYTSYPIRGGGSWPDEEQRPMPSGASHAIGAFDLHTGALRWSRWIDAEIMSAPVVFMGRVYGATFGGTMFHFEAETGRLLQARKAMATAAPTVIDGALYFSRREDEGGESWERIVRSARDPQVTAQLEGAAGKPGGGEPAAQSTRRAAPYVREDFQSRTEFADESVANDAANGFSGGAPAAANAGVAAQLIGRRTVHGLQEFQGSWVLGSRDMNLVTMGSALVAYDRMTGTERWVVPLEGDLARQGGALGAPPAEAGGRLVVATLAGKVLVVDAEGEVEARLDAGVPLRTQAVVDRGWVYVGSANGQVVALDSGNPELTGWPTWAGNPARTGTGTD